MDSECAAMGHRWGRNHTRPAVAGEGKLGRLAGQGHGRNDIQRRWTAGNHSVIATMSVASAGFALFLDVGHFAARRHLTVTADDAAAPERGETEKPNETHDVLHGTAEQLLYRCRDDADSGSICAIASHHRRSRVQR